jgi:phospholipase C
LRFYGCAAVAIVISAFSAGRAQESSQPKTPIQHVVIIFQENQSFDHYFGTYPQAENLPSEPPFHALAGTPEVNGLSEALRTHNPNLEQPWRISRKQAATLIPFCDNDHGYTAEQRAYDGGRADKFVQSTGAKPSSRCPQNFVMGYLDGNTVTALWNYAQRFGLSDNFFNSTYGPSMLGALNLAAGQTAGAVPSNLRTWHGAGPQLVVNGTMIGNPAAAFDDCTETSGPGVLFTGKNIGDLLTAQGVTWGWFSAGFTPTQMTASGKAVCGTEHLAANGRRILVYDDPDPFDYFRSTANPHHKPPSSIEMVGKTDQANHQYDLDLLWKAAETGHMPAVAFIRGPQEMDGHPGYSGPLPEQKFIVETMNHLQALPQWKGTAVFLTWDDSDGWYDHVMPPNVNHSQLGGHDELFGKNGMCGAGTPLAGIQGRCAYGPRLPLLILSPFAKINFVNHDRTDQSSIIRFIEDNWSLGRLGGGSLDELAGSLLGSFDFDHPHPELLILDSETGELATSSSGPETISFKPQRLTEPVRDATRRTVAVKRALISR